jgi:hypothetical protein
MEGSSPFRSLSAPMFVALAILTGARDERQPEAGERLARRYARRTVGDFS